MIEETYIKEIDKLNEIVIVTFEGRREDINTLRDYVSVINSTKYDMRHGIGKYDSDDNAEDAVKEVEMVEIEGYADMGDFLQNAYDELEKEYAKAHYDMTIKPSIKIDFDKLIKAMAIDFGVDDVKEHVEEDVDDINVHNDEEELCDVISNIMEEEDMVNRPSHYCAGKMETIEKIEAVINGLPAKQASCLANVLKYFDRAGLKDDAEQDLDKANNYAHRLVHGSWRYEH